VTLGVIAAVFVVADVGDQLVGGDSFLKAAPLDEIAHLLTTFLVLWAIGGILWERMLTPALIASVAIDLDHIPARFGADFLTAGTPRPYTHSLLTIVVVVAGASLWRRRREALVGVAVGLVIHFWRDMAEPASGVSLLWPVTDHSFSLPHASYLLIMAVVVAAGMRRSLRLKARGDRSPGMHVARRNDDRDPLPLPLDSAGTTRGDAWL